MNQNFNTAFDFILKVEGGFVDDKNDKGGQTKYGISKKAFPDIEILEITLEQAKEIYRKHYWKTCCCDELPSPFDIVLFDCAVNQGPKKAVILLQKALNIKDDGFIGPRTIEACHDAGEPELRKFLLRRLFEYSKLEDYKHYGKGWFNRLLALSEAV